MRHAEQVAQPCIELPFVERQEKRAAGIARIADMRPLRQFEDQPAFDRSESEVAPLVRAAHRLVVIEHPAHLGGREIRIEQQAGSRLDLRLLPALFQRGAEIRRAAILPDDRARQRFSARPVPRHHGFALIGDPDRGHTRPVIADGLARTGERLVPDFACVVLHPAGARIMLRQLALGRAHQSAIGSEQNGARRGRARVEDEDMFSHESSCGAPRTIAQAQSDPA